MDSAVKNLGSGRRGVFWTSYVTAWAGLALAAASYLALSLADPERMAQWGVRDPATGAITTGSLQSDQGPNAGGQIKQLRGEVDELRSGVAEIRARVDSHGPAIARVSEAVEMLRRASEQAAAGPATPATGPVVARAPDTAREPEPEAEPVPSPRDARHTGWIPPLPTRAPAAPRADARDAEEQATKQPGRLATAIGQPRVLNQPAGETGQSRADSGVTTGSLPLRPSTSDVPAVAPGAPPSTPAPVVRFGAPVVTAAAPPPGGGVAVRLSSGASLASLRVSWQVLRQLHGEELGELEGRYRVLGATYQLLAGPFADRQQADQACSRLRAKSVPCSIDSFGGNAL